MPRNSGKSMGLMGRARTSGISVQQDIAINGSKPLRSTTLVPILFVRCRARTTHVPVCMYVNLEHPAPKNAGPDTSALLLAVKTKEFNKSPPASKEGMNEALRQRTPDIWR
jgi:hypothetical protein